MKLKTHLGENKIFLLTLLICVISTSTIMLLIYKNNKYYSNTENMILESSNISSDFADYIETLYNINISLKDCINGLSINTKDISTILQHNIKILNSLKSKVASTILEKNDNPDLIPKLVSCIDLTKNLYQYCLDTFLYESDSSISEIISELLLIKENCINSYEQMSHYGIVITLPDETIDFLDNFIGYLGSLDKLNKEQSIKITQNRLFMKNLTDATSNFSKILENLEPAIDRIRVDNRSLDIILDDIDKKRILLDDIKNTFNYSSIPQDCISYYNSLNNIFKLYSTYLDNLKIAIIYEKSYNPDSNNSKDIKKNYSNAASKFTDVKTSFDSLINSLD